MTSTNQTVAVLLTLVVIGSAISVTGYAGSVAAEPIHIDSTAEDSSTINPQMQDITAPDCEEVEYDGSGTAEDPYLISSVDQLQCIENDQRDGPEYSDNYRLTADINAEGTTVWNDGNGFEPIGSGGFYGFTGTFNGDNHTISGLTVSRGSSPNVGLFADSTGSIKNLNLREVDIEGSDNVGAVVGSNSGTLTNVTVGGTVQGDLDTGGAVGFNSEKVKQSNSSATISAGSFPADIGGLVGDSNGDIQQSYATGDVNAGQADDVGGLVGELDDDGTVSLSYAAGSVSGDTDTGGLIGVSDGTTFSSYWDVDATGQDFSPGSGTIGLTTDEMTGENAKESMSLDFSSSGVWRTQSGEYPQFKWQVNTEPPATPTPNMTVSTDSTNSPVTEGEELSVAATIENTGDATGIQLVSLSVGDTQRDSTTVTVNSGESTAVNLSWATESGDAGNYTATVASDNDSSSTSVSVLSPSNVVVSTDSTNTPVTEGEELSVAATVENTGDTATTQTISLSVGDIQRDSTTVTLDSGESAGINLSWTTESGDAGDYTATVASADETASTPVTVSGDGELSASFDKNQSTILVGNAIRFNGSASTDPDGQITDYRWDFDGDGTTDATGRTVTRTFDSAGNYTVELTVIDNSINTDTVSRTITVESESNGTDVLTVASAPKTVAPDTTFKIDYTIKNAGSQAASHTLNINDLPSGVTVDGFAGDIQSSSPEASPPATSTTVISPGDTATVTVTYRAEAGLSGDKSVGVEAVQPLSGTTDTASSVVAVQRPANHSVSVSTAPSTVVQDTEFEITYNIENTASQTTSYTLTGNEVPSGITVVSFSGDIQSSSLDTPPTATTDAIAAGSSGSVTITYQMAANVTGNKTVGLTATNPLEGTEDTTSSTLTATETPSNPEERALQIAGVSSPTELTQSDVTVAITKFNRGQTANGLTIEQNDVTVLITLFERN